MNLHLTFGQFVAGSLAVILALLSVSLLVGPFIPLPSPSIELTPGQHFMSASLGLASLTASVWFWYTASPNDESEG